MQFFFIFEVANDIVINWWELCLPGKPRTIRMASSSPISLFASTSFMTTLFNLEVTLAVWSVFDMSKIFNPPSDLVSDLVMYLVKY